MRRKLIISNSIILFISLVLMMVSSLTIIINQNEKNYKSKITEYLTLSSYLFDGSNQESVASQLKAANSNIRITVINMNGVVVFDSEKNGELENHLQRSEIKNIGSISKRYSKTLKENMLYMACVDDGYYLRIALPMKSLSNFINNYLVFGSLSLIVITTIFIFIIVFFSKNNLKPVNNNIRNLSRLIGDYDLSATSVDDLPKVLNEIKVLLEDKIEELKKRDKQYSSTINYISQGLLVLDENKNIMIANNKCISIYQSNVNIIGKSYLYLIRDLALQEAIQTVQKDKSSLQVQVKVDDCIYRVMICYIDENWIRNGVILSFIDITSDVESQEMKKDFFNNASHELKSPLTCIIGYEQLIIEDIISKDEVVAYSEKVLNEAKRMNNIINDMLDLSRIEQEVSSPKKEIRVDNIVKEVIESLDGQIRAKNLLLVMDIAPCVIESSETDLYKVVRNIIDNSVKYTNEGEISISLKDNVLLVKDTGIGISKDEQKRVFERFYRVDKGRSKSQGGTGLGLAIVKHICELYGYKITLDSELGKGTSIAIELK